MHSRKADTRHKIQLGGLVIKAGLGDEAAAVILGALLTAAEDLAGPAGDETRKNLRQKGEKAFGEVAHV
jgi:hypothetical protein